MHLTSVALGRARIQKTEAPTVKESTWLLPGALPILNRKSTARTTTGVMNDSTTPPLRPHVFQSLVARFSLLFDLLSTFWTSFHSPGPPFNLRDLRSTLQGLRLTSRTSVQPLGLLRSLPWTSVQPPGPLFNLPDFRSTSRTPVQPPGPPFIAFISVPSSSTSNRTSRSDTCQTYHR
ncbi:hypothetical protein GYMLUDRAFT_247525 [Collybiopsis luxurians FD-317 M1]|uniref:Uncharacterized protein n=1 Tax=Collybiopsis luxurians FD-317 M1 TaxID=944289 RepID=A0A0D0CF80_9AGAR|nr:hypothetical protein GYMLUDRAFT_247525 [Collybiopsis luxurians FD-317 M1]